MGKGAPTYTPPKPEPVKTAGELFQSGNDYAKSNFGNAYGAREGALSDLGNQNYYQSFQPTSIESALGNQYFQNVWPDTEAYTANVLSKSGMAYSPAAGATLGKQYGNLSAQIAQYLADQGNQRAQFSLQSRLGIDPTQMVNPFVNVNQDQSNTQTGMNNDYAQQVAQANYQNELNKFNQKQQLYKTLGMVSPVGGAIYGGIDGGGAGFGSSVGGSMDTLQMAIQAYGAMNGGMGGFGSSVNPGRSGVNGVNPSNFVDANKWMGANMGGGGF